ncbi:uncharacterized protein DUF4235 [Brevibacterium sanguinis]|uniref:Uncharacterized protein DUF4235 n=2 Tax=Brevibacterium TaxID=1696 RepID=A0A366IGA1_9MICO|nr:MULTISPECIES: DUF4235 domain-containing protein [Brevibacterium]RBP61989.1 uncharacterized protein DUF4235 [Brevibacterium sanguinis]RBP70589.1 uncharacterized protein DUF4235 [Brevibacterium celere]
MTKKKSSNTSAKILYRPIGLLSGVISGALAGIVFKQVWKRVTPSHTEDAPKALESEFDVKEILLAAAVQGAIFAVVKAAVDRAGARGFQKLTGEWPGD